MQINLEILKDKRVLIGLGVVIVAASALIAFLAFKNSSKQPIPSVPAVQTNERAMTEDEKVNRAGIDPKQEATVINDQNGNFIYKINK